jgi:hypothetical protein
MSVSRATLLFTFAFAVAAWTVPCPGPLAFSEEQVPLPRDPQLTSEPLPIQDAPIIVLSQEKIHFDVNGPPGLYEGDILVDVSVQFPSAEWAILCHAEPLSSDSGEIPPSRIFFSHLYAKEVPDQGAGTGYQSLEEPRLVAQGAFASPALLNVNTLRFRLLTTWEDKPGTYIGIIRFTYLVKP